MRLEAKFQAEHCDAALQESRNTLTPRLTHSHAQLMRLEAMLQAERLQSSFAENRLQQLLGEERVRSEHMRALRDDAAVQRWTGPACYLFLYRFTHDLNYNMTHTTAGQTSLVVLWIVLLVPCIMGIVQVFQSQPRLPPHTR